VSAEEGVQIPWTKGNSGGFIADRLLWSLASG